MEKKKEIVMLGLIDKKGYEIENRVHFRGGCCPTQRTGGAITKVVKKWKRKS